MGDHPKAKVHARQAILAGEAQGAPLAVAQGYAKLARAHRQTGDVTRAEFFLDEAFIRFERLGARYGLGEVCNTRGEISRARGDFEDAKKWYLEATDRFTACGHEAASFARLNLGMTFLEAGAPPSALPFFDRAEAEFMAQHELGILAATRVCRLPCFVHSEDWDRIANEMDLAIPVIEETGLVDIDLGRFAQLTAQRLDEAGRPLLARRAWKLALFQWESMGREEEAAEASRAMNRHPPEQ